MISRLALVSILALSCSRTESTSSINEGYVGSPSFRGIYYAERIYVTSDRSLRDVKIGVNGHYLEVGETTTEGSSDRAYHTPTLELSDEDIVHASAIDQNNESLALILKTIVRAGQIDFEDVSDTFDLDDLVTSFPNVLDNEVDAVAFLHAFNQYRSRNGLSAVRLSVALTEDAARNNQMQLQRGLGHHFMGRAMGQNSAVGQRSIRVVLNSWHNSSGHRRNMLGRWQCLGIHKIGRFWTQNFSVSCNR